MHSAFAAISARKPPAPNRLKESFSHTSAEDSLRLQLIPATCERKSGASSRYSGFGAWHNLRHPNSACKRTPPLASKQISSRQRLLVTQSHDRIDAHRPSTGNVAGCQGDEREQNRDARECGRIV